MKKVFAFFSSLLLFAGLKAQTREPAVKKETTVKPQTVQNPVAVTPDPTIKGATIKQVNKKGTSYEVFKKTTDVQMKDAPVKLKDAPVQMKEAPAAAKPHKG